MVCGGWQYRAVALPALYRTAPPAGPPGPACCRRCRGSVSRRRWTCRGGGGYGPAGCRQPTRGRSGFSVCTLPSPLPCQRCVQTRRRCDSPNRGNFHRPTVRFIACAGGVECMAMGLRQRAGIPASLARAAAAAAAGGQITQLSKTKLPIFSSRRKGSSEQGSTLWRRPAYKGHLQACGPVCSADGFTRGIYGLIESSVPGAAL